MPTTRIKKNAIFLIDGSSFLYRAFYGLRPLHTSKGIPVQATYGFVRALKKLIDDFDPHYIALVWDSKGPTTRQVVYAEYKATRQAPPSDLAVQREQIKEFASLIGMRQVEQQGIEADDLIASLVHDFKGHDIVLVSPDKDLQQLISDRVIAYDPIKKEIFDEQTFKEKYGFQPPYLLLYHALLGDASDNIPGVVGIGKKGAQDLTIAYHTLENVYTHIDQVTPARARNALLEQKENAYLSEQLFRLQYVDLGLKLHDLAFDKHNFRNAIPLFESLEFKSLIQSFGGVAPEAKPVATIIAHDWDCVIVQTLEQLDEMIQTLQKAKVFAFDTETSGLNPLQDRLVGLSLACSNDRAYYIPLDHAHVDGFVQLDRDLVINKLRPIFEDMVHKKLLHHAKFDQLVLWHYKIDTHNMVFDTIIAAHLVRNAWQKINLKALSLHFLDEAMLPYKELMGKKYKSFDQVPIADGARYSAHDALQTFKLTPILQDALKKEPVLEKLYYDMELPICQILYKMERVGICLDPAVLAEVGKEIDQALFVIEKKIEGAISHNMRLVPLINLNSPKQVEQLLFDELGLPVIKKSPEGRRSTDQEVLEELSSQHPVPGLILKYRELFKLKSTYVEPLPKEINPETGRIHTTFNQTDVATGRLSSSDPNLQNIPVTSAYGMRIRSAFVAPDDRRFLSADYSQIELRVLAHLSGDENLRAAFIHGADIHAQTAAEIFGVALDQVTPEQRAVGKRINFSIMYGLTPYGLSRDLNIKPSEAKLYIERYFAQYPRVAPWMEEVVASGKTLGYVQTAFGRRRHVPELLEKNKMVFEAARRAAINTPVQGTTADIIKIAMIKIDKELTSRNLDAHMLLQIHDELLIEFDPAIEIELQEIVKTCMETVVDWEIPLTVALRVGKNWAEVTK